MPYLPSNYDYSQELAIVWIKDPFRFRYLREAAREMAFRVRAPGKGHVLRNLIGYATLRATALSASPGQFWRRYWFLYDRDLSGGHGWPSEAVGPRSVQVRKPSVHDEDPPSTQI